jgi:hypothetical protein
MTNHDLACLIEDKLQAMDIDEEEIPEDYYVDVLEWLNDSIGITHNYNESDVDYLVSQYELFAF